MGETFFLTGASSLWCTELGTSTQYLSLRPDFLRPADILSVMNRPSEGLNLWERNYDGIRRKGASR